MNSFIEPDQNKKKCIIIPAYNEEKNIERVIAGIKKYFTGDIIVVDDGSTDATGKIAKDAGATLLKHPFNLGYGVALQTGYKYALIKRYDFLLQMDGDGQHDPRSIPEFFDALGLCHCDILIGSRFLTGDYKNSPAKAVGVKVFRTILKVICRQKFTDPTSGYQCMNRKVFSYFTKDSFPSDYPDANIIVVLHRMNIKIKEMPVRMFKNPSGESMHRGFFKISYYLFKVILSIFISLIRDKSYYYQEVE